MPDNVNDSKIQNNPHSGHRNRMRNKYLDYGIDTFEDHEVLEFLLYAVFSRKNTNEIAHRLIDRFKSLSGVFGATYDELINVDGISDAAACYIKFLNDFKNKMFIAENSAGYIFSNTTVAGEYCCRLFSGCNEEKLYVISLNSKRGVVGCDLIKIGNDNTVPVDMREIASFAIKRKAAGVIITHNHPGDTSHPSLSDIAVTQKIALVLENMDIALVDHIVCSGRSFTSMAERGMIDE